MRPAFVALVILLSSSLAGGAASAQCTPITNCVTAVTCTTLFDSQCSACASGTYLQNGVADVCPSCTPIPNCVSALTCASALTSQCTACAAGYVLQEGTADLCVSQCAPGTFSATGGAPCTPCAAGTFASGTGQTSCTPCGSRLLLGQRGVGVLGVHGDQPLRLADHLYDGDRLTMHVVQLRLLPAGGNAGCVPGLLSHHPVRERIDLWVAVHLAMHRLRRGLRPAGGDRGPLRLAVRPGDVQCHRGRALHAMRRRDFASAAGQTSCTPCAAGFYSGSGASACSACTGISHCVSPTTCTTAIDSQCTSCSSGYFLQEGTPDVCQACSPITQCVSALTCGSPFTSQCTACAAGYVLQEGTADLCVSPCAPGTFSATGGAPCTPCAPAPSPAGRGRRRARPVSPASTRAPGRRRARGAWISLTACRRFRVRRRPIPSARRAAPATTWSREPRIPVRSVRR